MTDVIVEFSQQTSEQSFRKFTRVERRLPAMLCDDLHVATKTVIFLSIKLLLLFFPIARLEPTAGVSTLNEYQLVGQANDEAHLPCLIGRQLYCGEPYFIAWYKLNVSSKSWVRIEYNTEDELASATRGDATVDSGSSFNERVRFTWARSSSGAQRPSVRLACEQQISPLSLVQNSRLNQKLEPNFDCAQLTISPLELIDEGRYKCEITFSESLDFDKCPATTLSQLNVIARPNEPELLVNGRAAAKGPMLTFKEGTQVKLECQSSGGKPAPRIEWLNVSSVTATTATATMFDHDGSLANGQPEVQLMRAHWPQKKATFVESVNGSSSVQSTPITSSSVTISLTRYDLQSQFVCLVVPQLYYAGHPSNSAHEQLIKSPAYLNALLNQRSTTGGGGGGSGGSSTSGAPMLKWIKLDVQVKPSSVSVIVRDVISNITLEPIQWPMQPNRQLQAPLSSLTSAFVEHQMSLFYSLQLNRLYAIQCIVENSRPHSQVAWFNRTAPIGLEATPLNTTDYLVPNEASIVPHRVSSFTRFIGHANGTFRTTASLLLTTNVWDNFEELFCRVSNEAFQFDELIQVAPIISARIYVNYAPFAWLEAEGTKWMPAESQEADRSLGRVSLNQGAQLTLRCSLAANPVNHNTILQIEWLKDGRKLSIAGNGPKPTGHQQAQRIQIEKANHLHMPHIAGSSVSSLADLATVNRHKSAGSNVGNQLVASSKLIGSSSLTFNSLVKSDTANYSCHYKLIPAPSTQSSVNQQQQQQIKITSGQANQTIHVNVIEETCLSSKRGARCPGTCPAGES